MSIDHSPRPLSPLEDDYEVPAAKKFWTKGKLAIAGGVAAVATGVVGIAASGGGETAKSERPTTSTSSGENPGTPDDSAETVAILEAPEAVPYDLGVLEGADYQVWGDLFNNNMIPHLTWYLQQVASNPEKADEIPTNSFTDTPDSALVQTLKQAALRVASEVPKDGQAFAWFCPTSTDSNSAELYGCRSFSSLNNETEIYSDMSTVSVEYFAIPKDANPVGTPGRIFEEIPDNYEFVQAEDGTFRINSK